MGRRQEGHASTPDHYRDCPHDAKHNDNDHEGDDCDRDRDRDGERHDEAADSSQGRQEQD